MEGSRCRPTIRTRSTDDTREPVRDAVWVGALHHLGNHSGRCRSGHVCREPQGRAVSRTSRAARDPSRSTCDLASGLCTEHLSAQSKCPEPTTAMASIRKQISVDECRPHGPGRQPCGRGGGRGAACGIVVGSASGPMRIRATVPRRRTPSPMAQKLPVCRRILSGRSRIRTWDLFLIREAL
jgi:hypothetical protein